MNTNRQLQYPTQPVVNPQFIHPYYLRQPVLEKPINKNTKTIKQLYPITNNKTNNKINVVNNNPDEYDIFKNDNPTIKNYEQDINQIIYNKSIIKIIENTTTEEYIVLFMSKFFNNKIQQSPLNVNKNKLFMVLVLLFVNNFNEITKEFYKSINFKNIKNEIKTFIMKKDNLILFMIWFYDFKRTLELLLSTTDTIKSQINITNSNKIKTEILEKYNYVKNNINNHDFSNMIYNVYSYGLFLTNYINLIGNLKSISLKTTYFGLANNNITLFVFFYNSILKYSELIQDQYLIQPINNIITIPQTDNNMIIKLLQMYNKMFYFKYYSEINSFITNKSIIFCDYFLKPHIYSLLISDNSLSLWTNIMDNLGKIMLMLNINKTVYIATKPINSMTTDLTKGFEKYFTINKNLLKNRIKNSTEGYVADFGDNSLINFVYTGSFNYQIIISGSKYYSLVRYDTINKDNELNKAVWLLIRNKSNKKVGIINYNIENKVLDLEIISNDTLGVSDTLIGLMSIMELGTIIQRINIVNKNQLLKFKIQIQNIIKKIKRNKMSEIKNNFVNMSDPFLRQLDICK